jgi:hypothetical protein
MFYNKIYYILAKTNIPLMLVYKHINTPWNIMVNTLGFAQNLTRNRVGSNPIFGTK